jgi:hypothetical protein
LSTTSRLRSRSSSNSVWSWRARRRSTGVGWTGVVGLEDVLARLDTHGAELVGELEQYENSYRLCYVRGPEGMIVALAEELS